jgi:predicted PurR-regulated permease PerM
VTRSNYVKFWVAGIAVFVLLLYALSPVLLPFVTAAAVAFFLDPVADRLQRAGLSRTMATTVITAVFFLLVVGLIAVLAPVIEHQISAFAARLPGYLNSLSDWAQPTLIELRRKLSPADYEKLRETASGYAGTAVAWVGNLAQGLLSSGLAIVNLLSILFITPVITFYLLRDWDVMVNKVDSWLPRRGAETIRAQAREIEDTLSGFVRGQSLVVLALAIIYAVGLTAVGLDLGLIVGLVAGLISFIPYLGTISGFVVGIGLAVAQTQDWQLPAMVAAVFTVGQVIEGNVLTPKLVGDRVGLHPVWIMFALLAGGAWFGFLGILLAVPVAAVIGVLIRFSLRNYLASPLYQGPNPPA